MSRSVRLIGVPLDLGAGRRGVDMGPSALRIARLTDTLIGLGCSVDDDGNLEVPQREVVPERQVEQHYLSPITAVCRELYGRTRRALDQGLVPIVLGGDHSLAIGSVAAAADAARAAGERLGVVWLDAHGDMNTADTSPTGNIHGMPLACLLGRGEADLTGIGERRPALDPWDVALIGIRAIDDLEANAIRATGVHAYTMRDFDQRGVHTVIEEALGKLASCQRLHVSFDIDFVDPGIAPGVGTRVRGGPNYRETHLIMELLADTGRVGSVDVVELNPIFDTENQTAELAVGLLASLFGKRIL